MKTNMIISKKGRFAEADLAVTELRIMRSDLHELVWSTPLHEVADQLLMSDVGVAKLCDRNKVPRPPGGYWLRKHKRRHPPTLKGCDKQIVVQLKDKSPTPKKVDIDIPDIPANARAHTEVARCRSDLKGAKSDTYSRLVSQRGDMQVSPNTGII